MTIHEVLHKYWGYTSFRPLQEEIIRSVLEGKDTLALLPTGGGKSICFQVPGMAMDGLCLVISPLIALMKDQVQNLRKKGINAFALYSGLKWPETELIYNHCEQNKTRFLYISPERLESNEFIERIKHWKVNMIAVDEAHCISQWGYDFRPPYLKIAKIRQHFKGIPVLALTATAVPRVVEDIQRRMEFPVNNVFQKSFHRDNLAYIVIKEEDKKGRLLRIINKTKGTGIVYVRNRRKTEEIAKFLIKNGISATWYHAGLEARLRSDRQDEWMSGKVRVVVATNAFGMGIDKPDVRFVVHLDIPESLEAYFQEAGRAGRDEKASYSVMLFDQNDITGLFTNFNQSWPDPQKIKEVYLALVNFAKVPMGGGSGLSIDFDLNDFSHSYKLNPVTVYKSLSFLEKEGYIMLQDDIASQSKIHVKTQREDLYRIQLDHPYLDEVIKVLLRSYGGLFNDFVPVNEKEIASRIGLDISMLLKYFQQLQQMQVLDYSPKALKPQMIFCQNRIDEKFIIVNQENYLQQKENARKRLESVVEYVTLENHCRSILLLSYFGESDGGKCGKCDVCLRNNNSRLTDRDFDVISASIEDVLKEAPHSVAELLHVLKGKNEKTVLKVMNWMIENELIIMDQNKILKWNDE